jgi:hypothetical protein
MALVHLLAAALLFGSLPAFAQEQLTGTQSPSADRPAAGMLAKAAVTPSGSVLDHPQHTDPTQTLMNGIGRYRVDAYRILGSGEIIPTASINPGATPLPTEESADGPTCYTIRSYVVARDDKNSDSTHPVSSSTCQPANRYRVKKAVVEPGSSAR